jgi:hypothetical protein
MLRVNPECIEGGIEKFINVGSRQARTILCLGLPNSRRSILPGIDAYQYRSRRIMVICLVLPCLITVKTYFVPAFSLKSLRIAMMPLK